MTVPGGDLLPVRAGSTVHIWVEFGWIGRSGEHAVLSSSGIDANELLACGAMVMKAHPYAWFHVVMRCAPSLIQPSCWAVRLPQNKTKS